VHGEIVLLMSEDIYENLPVEIRSDIELGNTDSGMTLAHLLLIAASKGEKVVVFEDAIRRVFKSHHYRPRGIYEKRLYPKHPFRLEYDQIYIQDNHHGCFRNNHPDYLTTTGYIRLALYPAYG
jgi:hypothetical protein